MDKKMTFVDALKHLMETKVHPLGVIWTITKPVYITSWYRFNIIHSPSKRAYSIWAPKAKNIERGIGGWLLPSYSVSMCTIGKEITPLGPIGLGGMLEHIIAHSIAIAEQERALRRVETAGMAWTLADASVVSGNLDNVRALFGSAP